MDRSDTSGFVSGGLYDLHMALNGSFKILLSFPPNFEA